MSNFKKIFKLSVISLIVFELSFNFAVNAVFADSVNLVSNLQVLPAEAVEEPAAAPLPERIGGGARPGLIVGDIKEKDIFVSGEEGFRPYVTVMMVSGINVLPDQWFETMNREPIFEGKTNLRNAIMFFEFEEISGQFKKVYTGFANLQGVWTFISPIFLPVGTHSLSITAMSPVNPFFKVTKIFQFDVIPIPEKEDLDPDEPKIVPKEIDKFQKEPEKVVPDKKDLEPLPIIEKKPEKILVVLPPTPKAESARQLKKEPAVLPTPIPQAKKDDFDIYGQGVGLKTEVLSESKIVDAGENLNIKTKIINPSGEEKEIFIRILVKDPRDNIIYDKVEKHLIKNEIEYTKKIIASPFSEPGKYTVIQEVIQEGVTYSSNDFFEIKEKPITPRGIISEFRNLKADHGRLPLIFAAILFIFWLLLFREYRLSKKSLPIGRDDFQGKGLLKK